MKKYQIELFYGYEEGECGIYHAFEATDPDAEKNDTLIAMDLAEQLDCEYESDRFDCNSMYIDLPETLIARIKEEAVMEYLADASKTFAVPNTTIIPPDLSYHTRMFIAAKQQGWDVHDMASGGCKFELHCPGTAPFVFYTEGDSLAYEVRDYADDFDVNRYAAITPHIAKASQIDPEMLRRAQKIKEALERLACAIEAVPEKEAIKRG